MQIFLILCIILILYSIFIYIFTSSPFPMFIVIDLILSYNKKNYRNLISTKNLYDSLVFLVENVLFYTMEANKTIPGEFLILIPGHRLCDCHQWRIRLQRT
jgi:hypothetical protein